MSIPAGTTLGDIDSISWWTYTVAGYPPHVDIYLDVDGDGVVDDEDILTAEMANYNFEDEDDPTLLPPFITYSGGWLQTFELTSGDGFDAVDGDCLLWVTKMGGGPGDAPSGTLTQWKAGEVGGDPESEITAGVIDGNAPVLRLEIEVDRWVLSPSEAYIDDITLNGVTYELEWTHVSPIQVDDDRVQYPEAPFQTIQGAIDCATTGDIISVYPGTYAEALNINEEVTLTGVDSSGDNNWTALTAGAGATAPTIDYNGSQGHMIGIDADNVTFQGFNIDTTDTDATRAIHFRSAGQALTDNTLIQYNTFNGASRAINVSDDRTVTDLTVTYNKFTGHASDGGNWLAIDSDAGISAVTQTSNVFSYNIVTGVMTGRLELGTRNIEDITWSYNSFTYGFTLTEDASAGGLFGDLVLTNNTFTGAPSTSAFEVLDSVEDLDWEGGTFTRDDVTINYNDFTGYVDGGAAETVRIVTTPTEDLNAEYNWWDDVAGPNHDGNPYDADRDVATAADVDDNVDYSPWMIHTTLVANEWNIYSTPITPNTSTDTISEALDIIGTDSGNIASSYYYNAQTQAFVVATSLVPMVPVFLDVNTASTIDVAFSASYSSPPSRTLYQGWNLVGPAQLYGVTEVDTMLGAYEGTGEAGLVGYTQIISPSISGQSDVWVYIRAAGTAKNMIPTEGYWVYMANQGTVGGFTYTPVAIDTTP